MPRLIILAKNRTVRQVNIVGPVTTLGRADSNKVPLQSEHVSRHHAAIEWAGDQFHITDLGSRNGTYVNQQKVRTRALANGDAITLGDCQLRFLYSTRALSYGDALRLVTEPGDLLQLQAMASRQRAYARPSATR